MGLALFDAQSPPRTGRELTVSSTNTPNTGLRGGSVAIMVLQATAVLLIASFILYGVELAIIDFPLSSLTAFAL